MVLAGIMSVVYTWFVSMLKTSRSPNDDHGHGTHVAGTAMGSAHGVARKATVHAVKVLGSNGSGSYSNIITGLGWCVSPA